MNSESVEILTQIAKNAEAIIPCSICGSHYLSAYDEDAENIAYGMATNAWKNGDFRGASREEIMQLTKSVIDDANDKCPSCEMDY